MCTRRVSVAKIVYPGEVYLTDTRIARISVRFTIDRIFGKLRTLAQTISRLSIVLRRLECPQVFESSIFDAARERVALINTLPLAAAVFNIVRLFNYPMFSPGLVFDHGRKHVLTNSWIGNKVPTNNVLTNATRVSLWSVNNALIYWDRCCMCIFFFFVRTNWLKITARLKREPPLLCVMRCSERYRTKRRFITWTAGSSLVRRGKNARARACTRCVEGSFTLGTGCVLASLTRR